MRLYINPFALAAMMALSLGQIQAEDPAPETQQAEETQAMNESVQAEANISTTSFGKRASRQEEQISCKPADCTEFYYDGDPVTLNATLADLFEKKAGKILVHFQTRQPLIADDALEGTRTYMREIAKRNGRVIIEPLYIGFRDSVSPPVPLVSDMLSVAYSLGQRIYNYFAYSDMEYYNAKVVVHPQTQRVVYVFFVHRNYGDPCSTLYSDCNSLTYLDEDTFDASLSQRLVEAAASGKSVSVDFSQVQTILPKASLDLDALSNMNSSVRIYKWFIAASKTEKIKKTHEKFLPVTAALALLKYSVQAYDTVQAVRLYSPARKMKAQVFYEEGPEGERIRSVVFTPDAD